MQNSKSRQIVVTGGTGFIGTYLIPALIKKGYKVSLISRRQLPPKDFEGKVKFVRVDLLRESIPEEVFEDVFGVIHLAGESIFGLWTKQKKKKIYESRILTTRNLVSSLQNSKAKPSVFISASAVGYYGDKGKEEIFETSGHGDDFLARVCVDWEKEAKIAESIGIRIVAIRTAPVLGHGGVLKLLLPIYKLGFGATIGDGLQYFPWIHIRDLVRVYLFALQNKFVFDSINACSPGLVTQREFSKTLANVLRRPMFLKLPAWGSLLSSQRIYPKKLLSLSFTFLFPDLKRALEDILLLDLCLMSRQQK